MTPLLSNCCRAPLIVVTGGESTSFWQCESCSNPADPYVEKSSNADEKLTCSVCGKEIEGMAGTCLCLPSHGSFHPACSPHENL